MAPETGHEKIGRKVKLISNAFDKTMNHLTADMDLTSSQTFLLGYLTANRDKVIYQKDIEAAFNIKHPTITGILKRLSDKGFLNCVTDEHDRRFKQVIITEKTLAVEAEVHKRMDETEENLLRGLTEEEVQQLHALLDKVIVNVPKCKHDKS